MQLKTIFWLSLGFLSLSHVPAYAVVYEEAFGLSARTKALGGAGAALSNDFSSIYYNPANLSYCDRSTISLEYTQIGTHFNVVSNESFAAPKQLGLTGMMTLGLCQKLPYRFQIGAYASLSPTELVNMELHTVYADPIFFHYDQSSKMPSIGVGLSYRPIDMISLGVGARMTALAVMGQDMVVPVVKPDQDLQVALNIGLKPAIGLIAGVSIEPISWMRIGATYRSPFFGRMDGGAKIHIAPPVISPIELLQKLQANLNYSPQQVAFGTAFFPTDYLQFGVDVTWYNWSAYPSPGPYLLVTPEPDSTWANTLKYANEQISFHDVFVPRAGLEYTWNKMVSARVGYTFRPSATEIPQQRTNLLDGATHRMSLGLGYHALETKLMSLQIDAYGMFDYMPYQLVAKANPENIPANYYFGGLAWNAGLALSVGY